MNNAKYLPLTDDSYALVTGASSGMGRDYAEMLRSYGYNLIIVSCNKQRIDSVKSCLEEKYPNGKEIIAIAMDLSNTDAARSLFDMVKEKRIYILINNAGVFDYADLCNIPLERTQSTLILHNYTPVTLCVLIGRQMKERNYGRIMIISSLTSWMPYPSLAIYAATKRFNKSFSRSLRIEMKGSGVGVTVAYFGAVSTELYPLSDKYRKLACSLGIMMSSHNASRRALKAMFRNMAAVMPGIINWIALPFLRIMPVWFLNFLDKKALKGIKFY